MKARQTGARRWMMLLLLCLAFMFTSSAAYKSVQLVSFWSTDLGYSANQVGLANGAAGIGFFVMSLLIPAIMRKTGPKRIMAVGVFGAAILPTCLAFVHEFVLFYIIMVLGGACFGMLYPAGMQILTDWFPLKEFGTANSILMVAPSATGIILTPLANMLCSSIGWRQQYILLGMVTLAVAFSTLLLKNNPRDDKKTTTEELEHITSGQFNVAQNNETKKDTSWKSALNKNIVLVIVFAMLIQFSSIGMTWVWYGAGVLLGVDSVTTSLLYSIATVIVVLYGFIHGSVVLNKLMRGNTRETLMLAGLLMAFVYLLSLLVPMPWQIWILMMFAVISVASAPMISGTLGSYYAMVSAPENVGTIFGIQTGICSIFGTIANSLAGNLINYSAEGLHQMDLLFIVCLGAAIFAVIILMFVKRENVLKQ